MAPLTGKSTVAGIIGWPVAHSLSPAMHNAAFASLGLDWVYVPFPVAPERLERGVAGLASLGVAGFNVTIPHKVAILPLLDRISPEAELIGAVNTVAIRDGLLTGYNTDGIGLIAALSAKLGFSARGRAVLVLGAGGAARSAVAALAGAGAARIAVVNRSAGNGEMLVRSISGRLPSCELSAHPLEQLGDPSFLGGVDLVVNTTSVGMKGDSVPGLELSRLRSGGAVYDMVYAPPVTPLLAEAGRLGIPAANGIGMLVAQGEAAFRIWTGMEPPPGCMEGALAAIPPPGSP
jgi:shikimate dehydrogenase